LDIEYEFKCSQSRWGPNLRCLICVVWNVELVDEWWVEVGGVEGEGKDLGAKIFLERWLLCLCKHGFYLFIIIC